MERILQKIELIWILSENRIEVCSIGKKATKDSSSK